MKPRCTGPDPANRGLFAINVPPRPRAIQSGLFNVPKSATFIRGYPIPPEPPTSAGLRAVTELHRRARIVTPLKDRINSVIRTHYPRPRRGDRNLQRQRLPKPRQS